MPRSRMSRANVTMKALSLSLATSHPLSRPMSRPIANITATAMNGLMSSSRPPIAWVATSQAANIGAIPTIDSNDRSNLPTMRISASARTMTANSDDCCSTLTRFALVRNAS